MKKLDLGQTISIVANVGVILGIVFLAVEVSQNQTSLEEANKINRASATSTSLNYFNDYRTLLAQDEQLAQIYISGSSGEELSNIDRLRFESLCQNYLWTYVTMHEHYLAVDEESRARGVIVSMREIIQPPGIQQCWETRVKPYASILGYDEFLRDLDDPDI